MTFWPCKHCRRSFNNYQVYVTCMTFTYVKYHGKPIANGFEVLIIIKLWYLNIYKQINRLKYCSEIFLRCVALPKWFGKMENRIALFPCPSLLNHKWFLFQSIMFHQLDFSHVYFYCMLLKTKKLNKISLIETHLRKKYGLTVSQKRFQLIPISWDF